MISLLNQTFKDFKLYVIDNMSTDDTLNVISRIKDRRIQILHNNHHQSCSSSLNYGLSQIKEDIVVRADGDNVYCQDYIESLISNLKENKIVYVPYKEVSVDGSSYIVKGFKELAPFVWTMLFCNTVDHNVAYYRNFIVSLGGYNTLDSSEDYKLWTDCLLRDIECISCIPGDEPKVTTYKTHNSITEKYKEINITNIEISRNFINKLLDVNVSSRLIKKLKDAKIYKNKNISKSDLLNANALLSLFIKKFKISNSTISKYKDIFYFYV